MPAAGKTGGKVAKTVAPAAQHVAGDTAGQAGGLLGETAKTATAGGGLPTDAVTKGGLPTAQELPLKGLPLG